MSKYILPFTVKKLERYQIQTCEILFIWQVVYDNCLKSPKSMLEHSNFCLTGLVIIVQNFTQIFIPL
jgi:hypothetical protein